MRKVLEEFANGNIDPSPRYFKQDSEYGRAMKVLSDCEDKLLATMNEDEKTLYEAYCNAQMDIVSLNDVERFVSGYRLGALMIMEVMADMEPVFL